MENVEILFFICTLMDVCEHMVLKIFQGDLNLEHLNYLLVSHLDSWSLRIVDLVDPNDTGDCYLANEINV